MKKITVGQLGKIVTGNTPPRNQPDLYGNHIIFIKPTDISETSKCTYFPEECYSEKGANKYSKSLIPKGSTCVVTIGSIGKKMTMAHTDCFINQAMNAIIPNENYDKEYVYYLIKNNLSKLKAIDSGTSSGRENVSKSAFSNMELDVIESKDSQKQIGQMLSAYDNLIINNQRQIMLLEEAAMRLYKEWFINLRFPGYKTTPGVDGVPEGWAKGKLEDIAIDAGKNEKKEKREKYAYYLPLDCLPKKSFAYTDINDIRLAESSLVSFKTNDILFGAMRPYFHKVAIARDEGLTRSTCFVINAKETYMWSFLVMLLFSTDTINYATRISVGTTMPYVRWTDFVKMPVLIPSEKVCELFGAKFSPIANKTMRLAEQNILLAQARDRLLPKLISGEIEV